MEILFARHGNTFAPGDKVVWVGRETDLPLVEKGLQQAQLAAEALQRTGRLPQVIYAASLQRTRRFAEIIATHLGAAPPIIDNRLDEVDYGDWAGRSNEEIAARGAREEAAMAAWNAADLWPDQLGWKSSRNEMMAAITAFAEDRLKDPALQTVLVVSSNGVLRFLPRLLLAPDDHLTSFKMGTGHLGVIERIAQACKLVAWNLAPEALSLS